MTRAPKSHGVSLRLSITDRCQLRCFYCRPRDVREAPFSSDRLRVSDLVRFVAVAQATFGVRKVRLTGGEPLLRADVVEAVRALADLGVPDLALTTNGQRLAPLAGPLRQAGLSRVNVSLDSLDPRTFARLAGGGDLAATLDGIAAAKDAGLGPLRINMVVARGVNDHEAPDILAYALALGAEARFIELMPSGLSATEYDRWYLPSDELRGSLPKMFELSPIPHVSGSSSRRFRVASPHGWGFTGFISPNSHPFCAGCVRLRLTANGRLLGCLGRASFVPVLDYLRAGGPEASQRLAAAMRTALGMKRLAGPFAVAMPMSRVGG